MSVDVSFQGKAVAVAKTATGSYGTAASVRGYRMQPLGPEFVAIVGRYVRTTAVDITDFVGGVSEGQVSR